MREEADDWKPSFAGNVNVCVDNMKGQNSGRGRSSAGVNSE